MFNVEKYTDMLKDEDRNQKYYEALQIGIRRVHDQDQRAIVLDLGSGTGLLSMMAVELGADEVYACEIGPHMYKCSLSVLLENGMLGKVKVIPKESKAVCIGRDLPYKANILVTEIFDSVLLGEEVISSVNDAHQRLLTDDCTTIPNIATIYTVAVECPFIYRMNVLEPIQVTPITRVDLESRMANCSLITNCDQDIQLDALQPGSFTTLSDPLPVFSFNFRGLVPEKESNQQEFVATNNGKAHGIFSWWELELITGVHISMRPSWAGGEGVWRFHWQNSAYYGFKPMQLLKGAKYYLSSYHNALYMWFGLELQQQMMIPDYRQTVCTCHLHEISFTRLGSINNMAAEGKYLHALRKAIVPGETTCICLTETSILPVMAAALGAKLVLVLSELRNWNRLILDQPQEIRAKIRIVSWNEIQRQRQQIDLVLSDPYFQLVQRGTLNWLVARHPTPDLWLCGDSSLNNLEFWYQLQKLRSKVNLKNNAQILPRRGVLKGIAVNFENLMRIYEDVGSSCRGKFTMKAYDTTIKANDVGPVMNHRLFNYKAIPSSQVVTLMEFNFLENPDNSRKTTELFLEASANALVTWVDWQLGGRDAAEDELDLNLILTGLMTDTIDYDSVLVWNEYTKQTIIRLPGGMLENGHTLRMKTIYKPDMRDVNISIAII